MSRWTERSKSEASIILSSGAKVDEVAKKFNMSISSVISLKYSLSDNLERVECQICHAKMKQIMPKHLSIHNISIKDYKVKFPLSPLMTTQRGDVYKNFKSPNKGKTYETIYGSKEAMIKKNKISKKQTGRKCPLLAGTGITGTRRDTNTFARSTYEANVDRIFMFENKKYIDELSIDRFELVKDDGTKISYCPDRIDEEGLFFKGAYLEIKGYMYPEDWEKIQLFRKQYGHKKLLVISCDKAYLDIDYNILKAKYDVRIPLWENDRQNYKTRPDLYVVNYKTPEYISFYQRNYPNHINSTVVDPHKLFIANKCLSFNRVSLGEDPYVEKVDLIAISDKRCGSSRKSSGEYNYELWKITTTDNKDFYVTNQDKTTTFYCYPESEVTNILTFFDNNNTGGLKYGRKQERRHPYIDEALWNSSDTHQRYILQLVNDKMAHKGEFDIKRVTYIELNKTEKARVGSFCDYEEWRVVCNKDKYQYRLTNFGNTTTQFVLTEVNATE